MGTGAVRLGYPGLPPAPGCLLATILMLGLIPCCQARLGESEAAIVRRFGEPLATVPAPPSLPQTLQGQLITRIYNVGGKKDGALIEVTFLKGSSVREYYFLEREKIRPTDTLNETQIRLILEANAETSSWEPSGNSRWKRKDGGAKAEVREGEPSVSLNPNVPLQTQLFVWSGLEIQSKAWEEFLNRVQNELETAKKQQEAEARKKSQQEAEARDLFRGI